MCARRYARPPNVSSAPPLMSDSSDLRFRLLLATRVAGPVGQHPSTDARTLSAFAPLSIVSIAVVVSAQSLYRSPALPWMMTAVIGGAMASEVLAQIARRRRAAVLRSGPP